MKNIFQTKRLGLMVLGFAVFLLVIETLRTHTRKDSNQPVQSEPYNVDTVIPAGHVLVPLQIQNAENINALLGQMGVVDLWTYDYESRKKSKKIATQVKLIRAPLDPSVFAVMVREEESKDILEHGDQFYVTVHRPDSKKRPSQKSIRKQKIEIETFSQGERI